MLVGPESESHAVRHLPLPASVTCFPAPRTVPSAQVAFQRQEVGFGNNAGPRGQEPRAGEAHGLSPGRGRVRQPRLALLPLVCPGNGGGDSLGRKEGHVRSENCWTSDCMADGRPVISET